MALVALTGGGTAGHVIPNLALVPALRSQGWDVEYIGSSRGMEKDLVSAKGIPYHGIASGKLRRYFDLRNFTDPLRVAWGTLQAWRILRRCRPAVVFSKGGFVTVPVVFAARLRGIPCILHESDISPGLANRLCQPFARTICYSFPETGGLLPSNKAVHTGTPIRPELLRGDRSRGLAVCGFGAGSPQSPVLIVMGGSLGSRMLNQKVRAALPDLLQRYRVVHLCGKGGLESSLEGKSGYRQVEFLGDELPHVLAAADLALSRAGANALFELLALRKPNLLVPLSRAASRGDQILNAEAFRQLGYSRVVQEESLSDPGRLVLELDLLIHERGNFIRRMDASPFRDGTELILQEIRKAAGSLATGMAVS